MSLFERIDQDLVTARKERDGTRLSTLGLLKTEVVKAAKEPGSRGTGDDDLVLRVLRKEVKRREEAARVYESAGRAESARREEAEAEVLRAYLPAELDEAAVEREVRAAIDEVKPQGPRDFGAVMKAANARLAGRADGGRVAAAARRLLGS
ncbi:MAG TPA: GatB/YqeY domain-containing protein [Candidatus Dormibacteraeota bacterium]|nr:GatB/YqeY domain-containing protein [Candidatus Dormibacteraeota bacterium]